MSTLEQLDERPIIPPTTPEPISDKELRALPEYQMIGERDATPEELARIGPTNGPVKIPTFRNDLVARHIHGSSILYFADDQGYRCTVVLDRQGKWWKQRI